MKQDYKLKKILGSGSYGQVVKAEHKKSQRTVAIKFMDETFKSDYRAK